MDELKDKPKLDKTESKKGRPESRVHVTERPFTLHIDDTPDNVARDLFGTSRLSAIIQPPRLIGALRAEL